MVSTSAGAIDANKVELTLAQLAGLPRLPPLAVRLAHRAAPGGPPDDLLDEIHADPLLAVRLRNRAGLPPSAGDVERPLAAALDELGWDVARRLLLGWKLLDLFPPAAPDPHAAFQPAAFWKHSLAVACAARQVAALFGAADPGEAFACGLLHDVGKAALSTCMPRSFDRVVRHADAHGADIAAIERGQLGFDHTIAGHRLAAHWGLPAPVAQAIWLHHHPADALPRSLADRDLVQFIQLADALARERGIGYSGNHAPTPPIAPLAAALGLSTADCDRIANELPAECDRLSGLLGLSPEAEPQQPAALARVAADLGRANATLAASNARLKRRSQCLDALQSLLAASRPTTSVRDACVAGATALRRGFDLAAVALLAPAAGRHWIDAAVATPADAHGDLVPVSRIDPRAADEEAAALADAESGMVVVPAPSSFAPLVERYRVALGAGRAWLLPIARDGRWLAGAIFVATPAHARSLRSCGAEVTALSSAVATLLLHARTHTDAVRLGEELADAARRARDAQDEQLRARSTAVIGEMAAGAAHELNSPLAVISGRAQQLREHADNESLAQGLDLIIEQAHRCSRIVSDLSEFADPRPPQPRRINLPAFLAEVRAAWIAAGRVSEESCRLELSDDLAPVRCDPDHLRRALEELLANALEAMPADRPRLTIKAAPHPTDESVVVAAIDNGRGMTPDVRQRAFDPFFSHRPAGRGRGLGLSRVLRWVILNGGRLRLESSPGAGTSVEIALPSCRDET